MPGTDLSIPTKTMKWVQMNHRHHGWRRGFRYYTTWSNRRWASGPHIDLKRWLIEKYGVDQAPIAGPPTKEQYDRGLHVWFPVLGYDYSPHWSMNVSRRRLYVTEEVMMLILLSNRG